MFLDSHSISVQIFNDTHVSYSHSIAECVGVVGNGKIDFREFLLLVHNYERPLPEDIEMREMFNALDKDRNGYVDRDELKASFGQLGISLTDHDVHAMMAEADVQTDRIYYDGLYSVLPTAGRH